MSAPEALSQSGRERSYLSRPAEISNSALAPLSLVATALALRSVLYLDQGEMQPLAVAQGGLGLASAYNQRIDKGLAGHHAPSLAPSLGERSTRAPRGCRMAACYPFARALGCVLSDPP